jgi:hypothetical protein
MIFFIYIHVKEQKKIEDNKNLILPPENGNFLAAKSNRFQNN